MQERQDGDERGRKPFWFTLFDDFLSIAQLLGSSGRGDFHATSSGLA